MNQISAVVLTKNNEKTIEKTILSLLFCDEILVVDDGSTDKTLSIIKSVIHNKVRIVQRLMSDGFAEQRNWAMKQTANSWVLFVDSDEVVTKALAKELVESRLDDSTYAIPRVDVFWGRELKHGEVQKAYTQGIIRLVSKERGEWKGEVHERFITSSKIKKTDGVLQHFAHESLTDFIQKVNTYSTLRAKELQKEGIKSNVFELIFFPLGKFIYTYFLLLGLLDGPPGFVYSFCMAFHSFLVRAKLLTSSNG